MTVPDLLAWRDSYPNSPGFKRCGPSEDAAKAVTPKVKDAHRKMLGAYRTYGPLTADEAGAHAGFTIWFARPRNSEMVALGLLTDTGERRKSSNGRSATVWAIVPTDTRAAA